jgi:hypothetical protein
MPALPARSVSLDPDQRQPSRVGLRVEPFFVEHWRPRHYRILPGTVGQMPRGARQAKDYRASCRYSWPSARDGAAHFPKLLTIRQNRPQSPQPRAARARSLLAPPSGEDLT